MYRQVAMITWYGGHYRTAEVFDDDTGFIRRVGAASDLSTPICDADAGIAASK
jgi:hypothetical protein